MKLKTAELIGQALDLAVGKAEGLPTHPGRGDYLTATPLAARYADEIAPSVSWADGGPIIERERIDVGCMSPEMWVAAVANSGAYRGDAGTGMGPTPLIAAMRAYVASKLGPEVELP